MDVKRIKCPVCSLKFKWSHVCRKMKNSPCITRKWAQNPPKKYLKNDK